MSAASFISRSANTIEALKRSRLKVGIDLAGQNNGFVASYTTLDQIEGEVTIEVDQDTKFDSVEITFEGTSQASVERQSTSAHPAHRPSAFQTFLKLRQPIDDTSYPEPRIFKSRRLHKFPFTFVVPEQLLPQACIHPTCNLHLRHAHTQLPPSLGDPMLASDGQTLLDDMAPQMSRISYVIRVSVIKKPSTEEAKMRTLVAVAKKVRIIPASAEQPPLDVTGNRDDYCMRKEKDVRKGLLRGKMGRLVVAASQPKPLQLPPPGVESDCAVSSAIKVYLRFDPEGDELPSRLGTLWSKLKVTTFFAAVPWTEFPSKAPSLAWNAARGLYTETVPLSSLCIALAQWEKHPNALDRCSSLQSTSSVESMTGPSASYSGKVFYTASIIVPISLPKDKAFVPTFHSCLISRIYTLDLSISYHTPNANVLSPSISLKIPIQITSAHRENAPENLFDITTSQMQVDEFFRPRSIAPPSGEYLERSSLASPRASYTEESSSEPELGAALPSQPPAYSPLPPSGRDPGHRETSIADFQTDQRIQMRC